LVVRANGHGTWHDWEILQESLPLSSLQLQDGSLLARFYNPTDRNASLSHAYVTTDVWGRVIGNTISLAPKKIATLMLDIPIQEPSIVKEADDSPISLLNPPQWRVGPNHGKPDPAIMTQLEHKISSLEDRSGQINNHLARMHVNDEEDRRLQFRLKHQYYALKRESLEYQLSLLLNQRKLEHCANTPLQILQQIDPEIAAIGKELNRLRIKRRIFDYVVQVLD
jgi:hypothetical protein